MLAVLLVVADFDPDSGTRVPADRNETEADERGGGAGCGQELRLNAVGFLVTLCVTVLLESAMIVVSMRGSILDVQPRAVMPYLLYVRIGKCSVEYL